MAPGHADRTPGSRGALGLLRRRRPGAARRDGEGQVRRVPAHAARQARRGVPQRDHRPAVRLDVHGAGPGGGQRQDHLADPRRAHPRDPGLPGPDGHAEPGLAPRGPGDPGLPGRDPGAARRRGAALAARHRRQPGADPGHRVRDVASSIYGRPGDFRSTRSWTSLVVGGRAGRSGGGGLRRIRGALGRRARGRGDRRPGRHQLDDPQLPRLPARHLGDAAGHAGPQPGAAVRHRLLHRLGGHRARGGRGRRAAPAAHRGRRRPGADRAHLERRRLPQARGARARGRWSAPGSTTARR